MKNKEKPTLQVEDCNCIGGGVVHYKDCPKAKEDCIEIYIDNTPYGQLKSCLGAFNLDSMKSVLDEAIYQAVQQANASAFKYKGELLRKEYQKGYAEGRNYEDEYWLGLMKDIKVDVTNYKCGHHKNLLNRIEVIIKTYEK